MTCASSRRPSAPCNGLRPGHARRGGGHGRAHGRHPGDGVLADAQPELVCAEAFTREEWQRITELHAEKNRATQENYMPGSIFKTVVGLAALEAGLEPEEIIDV